MKLAFSIEKARKAQSRISKRVICEDRLSVVRFVGGVDVAYAGNLSIGAAVVLNYGSMELVEAQTVSCKTRFPYVPTLLSFREVASAVSSIRKLRAQPNVFLVDGHGVVHPYGCGFASHLGVVLGMPTIGVAKGRLFGKLESSSERGDVAYLKHGDRVLGAAVTTKQGCKPVFVSVGHMVSLETAIKIVRDCCRHTRIPKPILEAHKLAALEKRKINIA